MSDMPDIKDFKNEEKDLKNEVIIDVDDIPDCKKEIIIDAEADWDTPRTWGEITPFIDDSLFRSHKLLDTIESTSKPTGTSKKTTTQSTEPVSKPIPRKKKTTTQSTEPSSKSTGTKKKTRTRSPKKQRISDASSTQTQPNFPVRTDSVDTVASFMKKMELPELAKKLQDDAVDGEALYLLSESDFVEYGLTKVAAKRMCERLSAGKLWIRRNGYSFVINPRKYTRPGVAYRLIWTGHKKRTAAGLTKKDLTISKKGHIVPKRRWEHGHKMFKANLQNWIVALMKVRREMNLEGMHLVKKKEHGGSELQSELYRRTVESCATLKEESFKAEKRASPRKRQRWE